MVEQLSDRRQSRNARTSVNLRSARRAPSTVTTRPLSIGAAASSGSSSADADERRSDRKPAVPRRVPSRLFALVLVLLGSLAVLALTASWAYAAPGDLDQSFGGDGKVISDFNANGWAEDVAVQADGKIVAAGGTVVPSSPARFPGDFNLDFALVRYLPNGSVDQSFGNGGRVTFNFRDNSDDRATAVAVQADGKIVVVGWTDPEVSPERFVLARYNTDGTLDTWATTEFVGRDARAHGVAIQPDQKIVVVGDARWDFAVARYDTDLRLDSDFGPASDKGKVITDFGVSPVAGNSVDFARDVAIEPGGKIVAAGYAGNSLPGANFALARYNTDGSADLDFGVLGRTTTDFGGADRAHGIAVQGDGKILAGGESGGRFALARYKSDGTLDDGILDGAGFGTDGKVTTDFAGSGARASDIAVDDDEILAAGWSAGDFALARYNSDGTPDQVFGAAGRVTTDFGSNSDIAGGMALQRDGKIVLAGSTGDDDNAFALARYLGDTTLDTTAPETTITSAPAATTNSTTASFEFSSSEPASTFECRLDTAAFSSCTSPKAYSGLAAGSHTFEVRATDAAGNTDATPASRSWTVALAPSAPRNLTASTAKGKGRGVDLKWTAPASSGSSAITGYRLYRAATSGAQAFLVAVGNVTSYNDNATTAGARYYYKITAVNSAGESPPSNEANALAK